MTFYNLNPRWRTFSFLIASLACLPARPASAQPATYRSDLNLCQVPAIPRPALRIPLVDPVFGTTITRITDPSMVPDAPGFPTQGLRLEYARYPTVNATNTRMAVIVIGGVSRGAHQVRDIATGALIRNIPRDGIDTEVSWHPTDPDLLFYRYGNEARRFHVDTGQAEALISLPEYGTIRTRQEGRPSDDWRYFAFLGYPPGTWDSADIVVADLVNHTVVTRWSNVASIPDWVGMSPSGQYVIAQFTNGWDTRLYRRDDLSYVRTLFPDFTHSDFAVDANGDDVLVYYAVSGRQTAEFHDQAGLASVRLRDGAKTFLLNNHFWWSVHVSGISSRVQKGWVLISNYVSPSTPQQPLGREIFWLKLDGSGTVRRIAHHHSDQADSATDKDYWAEPHATPSFDGSLVFFCSVWNQPFNHYDFYKVNGNWFGAPSTDTTPPAAPAGVRLK